MTHTQNTHQENNTIRLTQKGFTLIELMIALVIIGLIVGGLFVVIPGYLEQARVTNTQTTLRNLKTIIMLYKNNTGQYPSSLRDLIKQPTEIKGWRGPYLDAKEVPHDGWDHRFAYQPTPDQKHPYELYSYGGSEGKGEPKGKRISAWDV